MSRPHTATRAFVLGLDGVPWTLIEQWTDDGTLPNFKRLREEGATGPLESTSPPTTSLSWPSIATGVWPDKHGIYGFQKFLPSYSHRMYTSRDLRQPALWDQLGPSIVGNVPMTYPASEIDGELVTGMLTPSTDEQFTHPPELGARIRKQIPNYRISLDYTEYADRVDAFPAAVDDLLAMRRELLELLMAERDDWELFFFVFVAPDRLQHLVWDEKRLREHYQRLDEILGQVMAYTDDHDADLYVVSDHGFGPVEEIVYVNHYLEREGYLVRRGDDGTRGALARAGISRDSVTSALERLGITEERLLAALPRSVLDAVAAQFPGDDALYDVDYSQTTAFVHDAGNCFINDTERFENGIVPPERVPAVKAELIDYFESITDDDGDRLFRVFDGDELHSADDDSPDIIVNAVDGYESRNAIADTPAADPDVTVASHRHEGVVCCRGPSIEGGVAIDDATVVDVAPTLLHGLGKPVPSNADGDVRFDVFHEDAPAANRAVTTTTVGRQQTDEAADDDQFDDVEERLQGLGYME